jgi:hypothetical protein
VWPNNAPYLPSNPTPADGASDVPTSQTLHWQGGDPGGDPVTYTLAFGPVTPAPIVAPSTTETSYVPGSLDVGLTYYWVITASDGLSTVVGPTWSFSTTACGELTSVAINGPSNGAPGTYTFTASLAPVDAWEPISYLWDNGAETPTSTRTLDVGLHTLTLTATNCGGAVVSDTHTITISQEPACTPVAGVTLSITNTGAIYTDTAVHFLGNLLPDEIDLPYDYRVAIDGVSGSVLTATVEPLVFTGTFDLSGTHTASIAVWNCLMTENEAVTDSVQFDVHARETCRGLTSVTINGPSSGAPGEYSFGSSHEPAGTLSPISYSWDNGDDTPTSTRILDVGVHILTLTATNCGGVVVVSDTHVITITQELVCTQVSSVSLATTSGLIYPGEAIDFLVDIVPDTASKPYSYSVDYGDDTAVLTLAGADDPLTLTHSFDAGDYVVRFAAWNCAMSQPDAVTNSLQVRIAESARVIYLPLIIKE